MNTAFQGDQGANSSAASRVAGFEAGTSSQRLPSDTTKPSLPTPPLAIGDTGRQTSWKMCLGWALLAGIFFHLAFASRAAAPLIVAYVFCLLQLAHADRWRKAFYPGLLAGLIVAAGRLDFFWVIFSGGAVALWLVFAFWIGLFCALARLSFRLLPKALAWCMPPFLWVGAEYYRSELYFLKFAWLTPAYAFSGEGAHPLLAWFGVYGLGFLVAALATGADFISYKKAWGWLSAAIAVATLQLVSAVLPFPSLGKMPSLEVAGIQLEFPTEKAVLKRLDELARTNPRVDLIVMPEYTFLEPVPEKIKAWCRASRKHLVVCGKSPSSGGNFFNTAFVINPDGETVFQQAKSVPIQFFKDGLPATNQMVWNSPWGKLGICICYDLSYTRVTDRLVDLGARALIVPTMDVADWGRRQHELHARIAPARAAEYGIPIVRVASSGISQFVTAHGHVMAKAPFPGPGEIIKGLVELPENARHPKDRLLAQAGVGILCGVALFAVWQRFVPIKPSSVPHEGPAH